MSSVSIPDRSTQTHSPSWKVSGGGWVVFCKLTGHTAVALLFPPTGGDEDLHLSIYLFVMQQESFFPRFALHRLLLCFPLDFCQLHPAMVIYSLLVHSPVGKKIQIKMSLQLHIHQLTTYTTLAHLKNTQWPGPY